MPPQLALSTWSLHREIGISFPDAPGSPGDGFAQQTWASPNISLLEVPDLAARRGITRLEICSFHLNRTDSGFLDAVKEALADAGVALQALLIDDGDITHPIHGRRDTEWIGQWVDVAAQLGAESARIIAGKQPPSDDVLRRSIAALAELATRADGEGVRITTENWFDTTPTPREVHAILDALDGKVGLLADFGNWSGPGKYDDLASILGRAEYCHAKCSFAAGMVMDRDDYGRCLSAAQKAGYDGPFTLIYEGPDNREWEGIEMERDAVLAAYTGNLTAATG